MTVDNYLASYINCKALHFENLKLYVKNSNVHKIQEAKVIVLLEHHSLLKTNLKFLKRILAIFNATHHDLVLEEGNRRHLWEHIQIPTQDWDIPELVQKADALCKRYHTIETSLEIVRQHCSKGEALRHVLAYNKLKAAIDHCLQQNITTSYIESYTHKTLKHFNQDKPFKAEFITLGQESLREIVRQQEKLLVTSKKIRQQALVQCISDRIIHQQVQPGRLFVCAGINHGLGEETGDLYSELKKTNFIVLNLHEIALSTCEKKFTPL